ncbi:neprilysin-1 [Rhipicephalus microplus]|uniref:neprilysin-1 n=1 Tax=Rhipicephalus microplus TaxID=6941 RepID=UPI003F6A86C5
MAQEDSGDTTDSTFSETDAEFVTADYTELCLVAFGLVCVVALVATLAWYLLFYEPTTETSGRKSANFTRLLEASITRSVHPCDNFYRFVCDGWIRDHSHSHRSVADKVAEETMLDAQEALERAAKEAREAKSPARKLVVRSAAPDVAQLSRNDSMSSHSLLGQSVRQREHPFLVRRAVPLESGSTRSMGYSAVLKAYGMFESCTKVVTDRKSETDKLAEFMKLYTGFPYVEAQDPPSLVASMVELSLTWKIHVLFTVDLFIDYDEDGGRLTVEISRNVGLISWLQWRNILRDSGKLEEFFLILLQALPEFRPSEAEALSAKITDADSRIIAALRTEEEPAQAITYDDLPTLVPDIDPQVWVDAVNKQIKPYTRVERDHHVKVENAAALQEVGKLLRREDDPFMVPMFLGWTLLRQLAPRASYKAATFVFKDKPSYVRDCFRRVVDVMPLAAAYPFLNNTPTPDAEILAKKIAKDVRREFSAIFANTPWMDEPTRSAAEAKIRTMDEVLAKPSYLVDEDALDQHYADFAIQADFLSSSLSAARSATRLFLTSFTAGVHVATRDFNPLEVNAFYERELNAMFVGAAIMQPPYLDEKRWTAFSYGGLGAVVGHEVMHGFDERGKERDARGRLRPWWSPDVLVEYHNRVGCLAQAYGNGGGGDVDITVEDVADFASLPAALGAYRYRSYIRELGQTPTFLEFSGEQLFFLNYCFKLCSPDNVDGGGSRRGRRGRRGLYSTDEKRCNVPLTHLMEFSDAFGCSQPDGVFPEKCNFWGLPVGQTRVDGDAPRYFRSGQS